MTSLYLNRESRSEAEVWREKCKKAEAECDRLARDFIGSRALVEELADALEAVVRRHGYFAGKPWNLPPDDPIAIARATLEKVRKP